MLLCYLQRVALMTLLALGGLWRPVRAQTAAKFPADPIKFGQVEAQDLTAAPFVADSAAAAVVLCDYGRSQMKGHGSGLQVIFERITRIKILKKAGFDEASVEIPLYHREENSEKVSNLRGLTYNLVNGKVEKTRLETSGVFLEKRTPTVNVQKFTLPNVREGSVVEFAYTLTSDYLFNFQDWTFQRAIPVRWSEYRVSIPGFYRYNINYQTSRPFDVQEVHVGQTTLTVDNKVGDGGGLGAGMTNGILSISAPTEEHRWVLQNLPGLRPEPYMTTLADYAARLDFELAGEQWPNEPYRDLAGTWPKINARLLADEDFGGRMSHTGFLKDQVLALAAQHPDPAARAAAVRALVLNSVRYDGTNRYFAPEPLRKAYDAHRGSAADVNLLLVGALRDAGLVAHPLLLSTRDHGAVSKEFPLLEYFNYVAAVVTLPDGHDLLLDATNPHLPSGVLPDYCLNRVGRLVGPTPATSRWLDLTPTQRRVHYQQVSLTLDAQGGLSGKVHTEHGGYAAAEERSHVAELGEKKYLAAVVQHHEALTLSKLSLAHSNDPDKPLALDYEVHQPEEGAPGSALHLSPLREFGNTLNPFRHETRSFAVDFGMAQEETLVVNLALPAGYELAALPTAVVMELPGNGGRYVCSAATPTPGTVTLTSRLSLNQAVYPAAQYPQLREFYRRLLEKQAEQLVVQKKAGS
ncbi:DUF3857 domain-containing protein [Hymenobacter sp. DH14]|uniref:DUF3857 domain-containing protein n=1 Tax=Hymenobacter cyanobacteriorum TaxID=2926463 RepID=A0A9X2AJI2_9BACT|nr:DUF3857 domain-containing protein [Hymenobacter cyanobacteriorum]MCI1188844.1 DUF3857 domain-containing protein [Hymenobacter cyanobacteriorum]